MKNLPDPTELEEAKVLKLTTPEELEELEHLGTYGLALLVVWLREENRLMVDFMSRIPVVGEKK